MLRRALCCFPFLIGLVPVLFAQSPAPAPPTTDPVPAAALQVTSDRDKLLAGKGYTLLLTASGPSCPKGATPFALVDSVASSSPSDLKVDGRQVFADRPCVLAVTIEVPADALAGTVSLLLLPKDAKASLLGMVTVTVQSANPVPAGPIPTGLSPQLDMMWKVLPRRVVADNYGNRVADGFFAVEATFGNNTGYDIQVAALGFLPPKVDCIPLKRTDATYGPTTKPNTKFDYFACNRQFVTAAAKAGDDNETHEIPGQWELTPRTQGTGTGPIIPVDSYPVVRGTVEREQFVGTRAIVVNLVRAAGPVLLGIGGGFLGVGDNLTLSGGLLSGPFEKGLELVYPDLTINHLLSLDNRTLRDNAVIPNNTAVRINAFISRQLVMCGFPKSFFRPFDTRSSNHEWDCEDGDTRLPYVKNFDPNDVMERLGQMTLIGQQIQYLNRVRVVQGEVKAGSFAGPLVTGDVLAVVEGTSVNLAFAGINLQGTTVTASPSSGVEISEQTASADGSSLSFHVKVSTATAGTSIPLRINSTHGSTAATLQVVAAEKK